VHQIKITPKIFYGWWIVAACSIIAIVSGGIVIYSFTAFFDPIIAEFGWSYAAVSLAVSFRGVETGFMAPILGFFVDRWGPRWILFSGSIFAGLGLILLSRINTLPQFYGAFIVVGISMSCSGVGVSTPVVNNWFRRNLGKATGILCAGFAMGGLLVPVVFKLIESFGWREALVILGFACLIICIPLSFVVRHKPESYGYLPDGNPVVQPVATAPDIKAPESAKGYAEVNIGTGQALKSRTFWHLTLAYALQYLVIAAVLTHIMPFLNTVQVPRSTASLFAGAIPIVSIFGRLAAGWLSDKYSRKKVAVGSFAGVCIGTLLFDYTTSATLWPLILAVIFFSLSYGSANTLRSVMTREYFGRSRFATIFGFMLGVLCLGSILGPFLAGWTFDVWKSYHYAWIIFTSVSVVSLALLATTPGIRAKQVDS
jgi:MFS transporter, OFA family, oxalate/formate antiporter